MIMSSRCCPECDVYEYATITGSEVYPCWNCGGATRHAVGGVPSPGKSHIFADDSVIQGTKGTSNQLLYMTPEERDANL